VKKMLAVVFDDEKAAYEGVRALSALDHDCSIAVDSLAVIKKNADGTVSRERVTDEFLVGTVAWSALGGVIGFLGGPVGVAAGMGAGALIGFLGDLYTLDGAADFLSDVSTALTPGKYAIIADVDEESVTPVDTHMEPLGGVVFRTVKNSVEDERRARMAAARRAELDQLQAEFAKAQSDRKTKLQVQIDHLHARMEKRQEQDLARSKQAEEELHRKIRTMQKKADEKPGLKAAIETRIARLRDDHQRQHA
jgi:uncharacterized membrane protein